MTTGTNGTDGQGAATQTSAPVTQAPPAQAPEGFVEIARLNGALAKIQELTLANRTLTEQLAAKDQSVGSIQAQLAQKEAEWNAQAGEITKQLETANSEKTTMASKLSEYDAMQLKLKIIGELGQPSLYSILGVIPNIADEAALRAQITGLATFANDLVQKRETELVTGVLPITPPPGNKQLPTTEEGWQQHINSYALGSIERQKAFEAWQQFLFAQQ